MITGEARRDDPGGGAMRPDAGEELRPGDVVGGYTIKKEIGRGGMGVVYLARDEQTDRLCAVKQIRGELARRPDVLERFQMETKILASLDHPCIVTLYAAGTHRGRPYLVMQWIEGRTLRELIQMRRAPFGLVETLSIAIRIGLALKAAHGCGVVHRDLKPENVLSQKGRGLKVFDFGIAKLRDGAPTTDRLTALATPLYAAPEQLARKPVDGRADVYALALIIVELATGRYAFAELGETMPPDALAAGFHREATPNRLLDHVAPCPVSLSLVVERALSKNRDHRPDMATFVAALRREQTLLLAKGEPRALVEEDEGDQDEGERTAAPRKTVDMMPGFKAKDPLALFAPLAFRPVDRTMRMAPSASALLAGRGKTLEQARGEARSVGQTVRMVPSASTLLARQAGPQAGLQRIATVRLAAPLASTTPLRRGAAGAALAIPRPSIEAPMAVLQLTPAVKASPDDRTAAPEAGAPRTAPVSRIATYGLLLAGVALAFALLSVALALRATARLGAPASTASIAAPAPALPITKRPAHVE